MSVSCIGRTSHSLYMKQLGEAACESFLTQGFGGTLLGKIIPSCRCYIFQLQFKFPCAFFSQVDPKVHASFSPSLFIMSVSWYK